MSKLMSVLASKVNKGINLPWSIATPNHDDVPTIWSKVDNESEGPEGQYWKINRDDTFDKNVWVIEDEEPIAPSADILTKQPASRIASSKAKLQVIMTTPDGQRIMKWDAYADGIVLGETLNHFVMSANFDKFEWDAWGITDKSLRQVYGEGVGDSLPRLGGNILAYRINDRKTPNNNLKSNPWTDITLQENLAPGEDDLFTSIDEFRKNLASHRGKDYWLLSKSAVRQATKIEGTQPHLGHTTNNPNPNKVIEVTWAKPIEQPSRQIDQNFMVRFELGGRGGGKVRFPISDPRIAKYITVDEDKDYMFINFGSLIDSMYKGPGKVSGSFRGGSFNKFQGQFSYKNDDGQVKTSPKPTLTYGKTVALGTIEGYDAGKFGIMYSKGSSGVIGTGTSVGIPWGTPGVADECGSGGYGLGGMCDPSRVRNNTPDQIQRQRQLAASRSVTKSINIRSDVGTLIIPLDLIRENPINPTLGGVKLTEVYAISTMTVIMA